MTTTEVRPAAVRPIDPSKAYAPALDGLRALAALLVIALHVGIYTGQVASSWLGILSAGPLGPVISRFTVGVPIFFVLSGLLLYRPWADAAIDGRPNPSAVRYLWHRALRILPAYWVVAAVALLAYAWNTHGSFWPALRAFLLLDIYADEGVPRGITQTWSLATEVAFYVLLPVFAIALRRFVVRPWPVVAVFGVLELINLVTVVATHLPAAGPYPKAQLWLPEYLGFFAAGMALAAFSAQLAKADVTPWIVRLIADKPWLSWGVAVLAYVVVSTPLTGTTARYPSVGEALLEHLLYLVVAVGLVAPLLFAAGRGPSRLLSTPVAAGLGRISYGIFLWHMVIVEGWLVITGTAAGKANFWVLFPVTVLATIAVAALSFVAIERPARRLRGVR